MDAPLTGHCNCGTVRYEVTAPLERAIYCHCTRCQRRTGTAASAQAVPAPGSFRLLAGEAQLRSWVPGDGGGEKVFCGECGSAMFARDADSGEVTGIRMGTIDGDPGIRPSERQYVAYAAAWEDVPDDGLPHHLESRGG